jgi:signal transduction histidine kinase
MKHPSGNSTPLTARMLGSSSISAKLTRMNLMVSGLVLLLAVVAFFIYDLVSFRHNLIRNLQTSAQIVGTNSVSALLFDDPESATTTLEALRSSPDVMAASLVSNSGQVFASFEQPGVTKLPRTIALPHGVNDRTWTNGNQVLLAHRIVFQGNQAGIVYISARLRETGQRALQYLLIAAVILLFCMGAALLISATARRLIARPVIALAETARRVSRERDYSVRAGPHADHDEIAVLIEAFNEMLSQIQDQDRALTRARDHLEVRVQERTSALRAANRELEAFSYTVAHDLRGPLDAVMGMVYLLEHQDGEAGEEQQREILEQLRNSTRGMAGLIDDLLNLSRASTAALKKETVDLSAIARQIAEDLCRCEPERRVKFIIADLPAVDADSGLMRIALDNLIRNAWKYTSQHETACIEVGMMALPGETLFFVRDDGAGFDPKKNDQLFQPFHRLHSRGEFPGTGIGLATVQRILARHGGRIWAEGAVEKGATFWFTVKSASSAVA